MPRPPSPHLTSPQNNPLRKSEPNMRLLPALLVTSLLVLPALAADKPKLGTFGVDLTSIDKAVKPGDNFFLHVNGKWLATAVIPPDRSQTGSFQDLQILSEQRLKTIVADLEKTP